MAQIIETEAVVESRNSKRNFPLFKQKFVIILSCLVALIILLCAILILLDGFSGNNSKNIKKSEIYDSNNQKEEMILNHNVIYREKWDGRPPLFERPQKLPVKYVIISHTAGAECFSISSCSKQMFLIQNFHVRSGSPDIGYNFLIGGDGNIYVGRDWNNHNFHMNLNTIGISFIGNYIYNELNINMIKATQALLQNGVKKGKLDKDYILVAHNQTLNTVSPGPYVYKHIKFWPHFSPKLLIDTDIL